MAIRTQSVIDRIDSVTSDTSRKRFSLARISLWMNEAQSVISEASANATAAYRAVSLVAGAHQSLANDPTAGWIRLHKVVCNADSGGAPVGASVRQVSADQLDQVVRAWRAGPAAATIEYATDERDPKAFSVFPPAVAGSKLFVLASTRPGPVCVLNLSQTALLDAAEVIGLSDGLDVPMVDWVLYRLFSRDSSDPAYQARAKDHLAAAQLALGVTLKDAA